MVARSSAAPSAPWSTSLTQPTLHDTATVHAFSNVIGDVRIGSNVVIAPGTSIRADKGSPFHIGSGTSLQDGVVIHGLAQGVVLGDDQNHYSVWIGNNTSITHKVLIHGPVYIGDDCFIGFRSTIFNARVGKGSIVMMHALVQDVEIPPGRYVPSGSIITTQQQADRLPEVHPEDLKFTRHVIGLNEALKPGQTSSGPTSQDALASSEGSPRLSNYTPYGSISGADYTPYKPNGSGSHHQESKNQESTQESTMRLSTEILQQVRQLLAGGYRIGTEHIDQRRFRTNSWKSCQPIASSRESEVVSALEACLLEHSGEYVRLFGIGQGRQRVSEVIVQRPGDTNGAGNSTGTNSAYRPTNTSQYSNSSSQATTGGQAPADLQGQVQQLLNQGYQLGTEYANTRQYKANAWKGGPAIHTTRVAEAVATLQSFLAEHSGEYVRVIAVDPKAKRRVSEILIQTPNGPATVTSNGVRSVASTPSGSNSAPVSGGAGLQGQVQQLLNQGYQLGTEYANTRQYKANAWKGGPAIHTTRVAEAVATLQSFLAEHSGEYVRLIAVDPKAKRRVSEVLIHTPNGQPSSNGKVAPAPSATSFSSSAPAPNAPVSGNRLAAEALQQIRQLLAQGHRISTEYANPRQYKANAWKGGVAIQTSREPDVISSLESFLSEHNHEYVRVIGIEPKAKRRVAELVIHQPKR